MKKIELIAAIADQAGISKTAASKALNAFTGTIENALKKGNDVTLVGFGTFKVTHRPSRNGRNPLTGKPIKVAARNSPAFKAGKSLKDAIN